MQNIPYINLLYTLIPLVFVWYFYKKWTGNKTEIVYSTIRMLLQLLLIGYVLLYLFEEKSSYFGFIVVLFMILVSSLITLRNSTNKNLKEYFFIFISIAISGIIHLILIIEFVLDLTPFYEPRFVIPIAGMIFANCMNVISIAIERFANEIKANNFQKAREVSFKAAMIPQINTLLAVGLVALPGMMTGQILSGVDPLIAVRYQIVIMVMALSSAGISLVSYYLLKEKYVK